MQIFNIRLNRPTVLHYMRYTCIRAGVVFDINYINFKSEEGRITVSVSACN
jgi:hypothetical protein